VALDEGVDRRVGTDIAGVDGPAEDGLDLRGSGVEGLRVSVTELPSACAKNPFSTPTMAVPWVRLG